MIEAEADRQAWRCDECEVVQKYIDEDGCNNDPGRIDTGIPHFHLIGYYCEDCYGQVEAKFEAERKELAELEADIKAENDQAYEDYLVAGGDCT